LALQDAATLANPTSDRQDQAEAVRRIDELIDVARK
jgi:hypothetical protein